MKERRAMPSVTPPRAMVRGAEAFRRFLGRRHQGATPPAVRLYEQLGGLAELVFTGILAEKGVPDLLEDGPKTLEALAEATGSDADALGRVLRFLVSRGVVGRKKDLFAATPMTDLLRTRHPDSLRDWARFAAAPWVLQAWGQAGAALDGTSPFEAAHGRAFFDLTEADADAGALFDAAMRAGVRLQAQLLLGAVDFSPYRRICDVGGGTGTLLAKVLAAHPEARGTVAELPSVVARAGALLEAEGVAERAVAVAASFFEEVPKDHDLYLLSAVLHDWPDEDAVRILRTVKAAMGEGARCLVVDFLLPDGGPLALSGDVDMLMLILARGRERTEAEFARLFEEAGLTLCRTSHLLNGAAAFELEA